MGNTEQQAKEKKKKQKKTKEKKDALICLKHTLTPPV